MILLTWVKYDQYIQQTMQMSAMWNHSIDLNLIYIAIRCCKRDVDLTIQLLTVFKQWKFRDNNEQKYKNKMNKFLERRCCNHNINLFIIFVCEIAINKGETVIEIATSETVNDGLPFVGKDKA
ncbi:hypothetical protein RFI_37574 [Reticulomyxa filosa]|uniref:Uncharacterized protein n=1 Tax=Reticulomyxa filosa TaxID=46433 RepID=X6LEE3_RETFI|nr:hypothetical protein RFI_37574 [Reticulomyxa filosa]|eukprot:ETN99893.1 hypothetical protein RFI_37574 [Reticulomyxa filosa]